MAGLPCPPGGENISRPRAGSAPSADGQTVHALSNTPARGTTIRSDLELRLLRASVAISQSSLQAPALIQQALAVAERYGYVQTCWIRLLSWSTT
jgi:hypothetical protein